MKTLFLLPFIIFSLAANATDYYISSGGNDANNGTSTSTPWQTLNKLNSYFSTLKPGDNVLLNRGDVFYGSITANKSGTAGSPITIGAYGTGANPVITGLTTVSAWTNLGSNIWESTNPVSTLATLNMVVINGVNTAMGRTPNSGYLTYQSHSGTTSITSSSLTGTPNWAGAEIVVRKNHYIIDRSNITSQSTSTLSFAVGSNYSPMDGFGFFIQNDSRTLDTTNEWYYNPSTKKIRIYSIISPTNVQVSTVDTLVFMTSKMNITFDGISFTGANKCAMYFWIASNIIIQNCNFNFSGLNTIEAYLCSNVSVLKNFINNSNNNAIRFTSWGYEPIPTDSILISEDTIKNTAVLVGMGRHDDEQIERTAILVQGSNSTIEKCVIDSTGYIPIWWRGNSLLVQNNFITNFCFIKDDGGAIWTFNNDNNPPVYTNQKILNNIILNGIGALGGSVPDRFTSASGIYCDVNASNIEICGNTVSNCNRHGILIHDAHEIVIKNNTLFDNGFQLTLYSDDDFTDDPDSVSLIRNMNVKKNVLFAKDSGQLALAAVAFFNDVSNFGSIDSNYYARPIDDNLTITTGTIGVGLTNRNLAGWQSFTGKDANSHKSPKTITDVNDIRFEYNATASPVVVSLPYNYMDAKGATYNGTITLAPYSSAVLIRNGAITNQPPKANAGTDQSITLPTNTVSLNGNGTDPDGSISAYNWTEISGPSAGTITNATSASTSVTGLIQGVYRFQLKATDNNAATALDTVQITVNAAVNIAPVAEAGANQMIVLPASNTNIAGSGTDADGTVSSYNWTKISGPAATIVSPNSQSSSVTGLLIGSYKFQLTVTDNKGAIGKDSMQITVIESVLPLNLLTFKGQLVSSKVSLTWKTANEKNVSGFDIEKMTGNTWVKIGFIQSASGSLADNDYFFSDYLTVTGLNFYRLKIVDVDGKYVYSDIINVELKPNKNVVYQNVPNAFSGITTIRYEVADKALVKIMVFNGAGIQVADLTNEIKQPGSYQIQWNAENILSGNYFYTVIIGDNVTTKKMLKIN